MCCVILRRGRLYGRKKQAAERKFETDFKRNSWLTKDKPQPGRLGFNDYFGAGCRTRTRHPMITNHVLYLMS